MASSGLSIMYWQDFHPVMLNSLASLTPGMTAMDVAEILDELDYEMTEASTDDGECADLSDTALINLYLNEFVL